MRLRMLAAALAVAMASAPTSGYSMAAGAAGAARSLWIVRFEDAPLASYRGPGADPELQRRAAKATSPQATGARRLDRRSAASTAYLQVLRDRRNGYLAAAEMRVKRPLPPIRQFDTALHAVVLELSDAEATQVAGVAGVAAVERDYVQHPQTDAGPRWIGANRLWTGAIGEATRGEGIVVGVVDSGINRSHPSFAGLGPSDGFQHSNPLAGGRLGLCASDPTLCNDKLIGLYDFSICTGVHASTDCNDLEPNDASDRTGHGSHVASTAAGNTLNVSLSLPTGPATRILSGVAPHANLVAYKACEQAEDCRYSWLVAALDQAVADGVDVINYSIGGLDSNGRAPNPWTTSDALAMLAARDAGIVVVVAAGNEGPDPGSITGPANAPWVLAVANSTHDRAIVNRLLDLTGGASAPPQGGVLLGDGLTTGYGPVALTVPSDFPLCSIGSNPDSPPTGVSNPWAPGRFSGDIVVCLRGTQARVAKSNNVRLAGGGGMILLNQAADGEITVADEHSIPSTHLGASDGAQLLQWLGSGSGHRGRLEGAQLRSEPTRADILASSSGRGPVYSGDYLKPDLAAPGTSVLAASGSGNGFAFLSGTSMASPHVAGAVALLRSAHPDWTVSTVETALRGGANPVVLGSSRQSTASALEQGGGRADLGAAARTGLSMEIDGASLRAARPATGGDPRSLNLPSLVDSDCFERCQFDRVVTDRRGGGRWLASALSDDGVQVSVTPADFTLAAGASISLRFDVDVTAAQAVGRRVEARVRLQPVDAGGAAVSTSSALAIPVSVFAHPGALPVALSRTVASDRGFADITISGVVALADLDLAGTELVEPVVSVASLAVDPTNGDRYDNFITGNLVTLVDVPGNAEPRQFRLSADSSSPSALDVDLFVGWDVDDDGLPDEAEQLCSSTSSDATEECVLIIDAGASARRYWVMAQNWAAGPGALDDVRVRTSLVDLAARNGDELTVSGPASTPRLSSFPIRVAWDDPSLLPGETRVGVVRVTAGGVAQPFALLPVTLTRNAGEAAARVLSANAVEHIRLPPASSSERLVIDVPDNASRLQVNSSGSGEVDLYLARIDTPTGPGIDPAPGREAAVLSARAIGANEQLELTADNGLRSGRWYITPVNAGSGVAEFDLQLSLQSTTALAAPRSGAYFNPQRSGAGAFLFESAGTWGFLWYTYLQDRTPVWYIASAAAPAAEQGQWTADLYRARWNGSTAPLTVVGSVVISKQDSTHFQFGWNLDGESGSESYQFIDGGGCAQQNGSAVDINGFWYNPAQPGYGYSVNAFPAIETNGAYFFDSFGLGRWALGSVSPFGGDTLAFDLRLGSCPGCAYAEPTVLANIGSLVRQYTGAGSGTMALDLQLPAPLSGRWQVSTPVAKLTADTLCR